jgi:hypothetical protein
MSFKSVNGDSSGSVVTSILFGEYPAAELVKEVKVGRTFNNMLYCMRYVHLMKAQACS